MPETTAPALRARNPLTGSTVTTAGRAVHRGRYTVYVAAEYLACMALISVSGGLIAGESTPATLADPAIVLVRLTATSALFWVLALLTAGARTGRLAAAFGALVTAGVALNASNFFADAAKIFGVTPPSTSAVPVGGQIGATFTTPPPASPSGA